MKPDWVLNNHVILGGTCGITSVRPGVDQGDTMLSYFGFRGTTPHTSVEWKMASHGRKLRIKIPSSLGRLRLRLRVRLRLSTWKCGITSGRPGVEKGDNHEGAMKTT
jgi:hypothetical protein